MGKQRTGDEHIRFDGMPIGHLLGDYWAWNSSDLLVNTERGSFSEFIVSAALDLDLSGTKVDWGPYDVSFPFRWMCEGKPREEVRIEVKSAAYLQSWEQEKPSSIVFSIRPARAWDPDLGYYGELKRQSDLYVFCHYTQTDRAKADPLVLDDWTFYILPTKRLDQCCGGQKTISLSSLLALGPVRVDFDGIKDAVIHCIQGDECTPPPPSYCIIFVYPFCL
ncbi:hypothetical protein [Flavonifractor plautii]|uniref:hypothetical protein n=1 Tax=Flavonifractor plautii TaxID=292800 RepID=UPI00189C3461|nr:hypothetical protein [Flavonifractor plautii]